jgi:thiol-disulfide isomerase/thioredoxin
MFWLQTILLAQGLECPLEPELHLPPHSDYRPVVLNKTKSAKGFESWASAHMTLQRRTSDGAVGLQLAGRQVPLKPMGLLGVEGAGQMPLGEHNFATSPIAIRIFRNALVPGAASITIQATSTFYVPARCNGRLALSPWDGKGPLGFDSNGDGKVDPNSPAEFARLSNAVFELDGKGYQMQGVDWKKRALILNETELGPGFREGESLPDFAYTDRLKQQRLLSSHGDSWTLIDFWASWCGPCIAAFPQLKLVTETHNLSILGLNGDEDPNAASRMLAQFEVLWPDVQSTEPPSLMDYRLRVALYPTYLLLDPSRKIVARTESTLELLEHIRRLVPKRQIR